MTDPKQRKDFRNLKAENASNNYCADCNSVNPQWASVNHGIYICLMCSGIHRGLGTQVSIVKSLTMDAWTEKELETMKLGGNDKIKEFFEHYQITKLPIRSKYNTIAAKYYRKKIACLVNNEELEEPPSIEEGATVTHSEFNSIGTRSYSATNLKKDDILDRQNTQKSISFENTTKTFQTFGTSALEALGNFGKKATEFSKNIVQSIPQENLYNHATQSVSNTTNWISEKSKEVVQNVQKDGIISVVQGTATAAVDIMDQAFSKVQKMFVETTPTNEEVVFNKPQRVEKSTSDIATNNQSEFQNIPLI